MRVVRLTNVDEPSRVYTTNAAAIEAFGNEMGPMIGDPVVVVVPAMTDTDEVLVEFDGETYAVGEAELVLVERGRA
ncbi:hypothetical protein [Mycolicibacterium hodleri]|uniref:Uncharacterized protein n=1 Tax=Mycolicibacterium hodleri TaxID=49897 RepID=A0A502EHI8_9MYCO|nr:hypothetical protein [Mycolicibacterium hodleri]TPG37158.1 hypothetical protein EAH80_04795 [Mycolicibacterium hodleri]